MRKLWNKFKLWWHRDTIRMIQDFERTFPNRCPICSYYRFGRREMGVKDATPPHMACKEGNGAGGNRELYV